MIIGRKWGGGILIINQQNAGVSVARNNGLSHACGEYIWFIDSDDYIKSNILDKIYKQLKYDKLDGIKIKINKVSETSHPTFVSADDFEIEKCQNEQGPSTAVDYIVSRDYLLRNKIQFSSGIAYGEDTLWVFWLMFFKPTILRLSNVVYYYRMREGSAMHMKDRKIAYEYHLDSMLALLNTYKDAVLRYGGTITPVECKHLHQRIYWSTQNVLFDALFVNKEKRDCIIKYLVDNNFYPYPILWNRISIRYGLKNFLINVFSLFFPIKIYYRLIIVIFSCNRLR